MIRNADAFLDGALHGLGRSRGADVFVLNIRAVEGSSADRTSGYVARYGWAGLVLESIPELLVALPAVLDGHQVERVDVLHISLAGDDWSVLKQFDLERYRPAVVRLEYARLPPHERAFAGLLLRRHGYEVTEFYDELVGVRLDVLTTEPPATPLDRPESSLAPGEPPPSDVVLYVITYNAPGQLQLWLDATMAAYPELLRDTRLVLLNNSIDERTFSAYDRLVDRFGFEQIRRGNFGINRGRLWCAKHFDALKGARSMLWFEDDMLPHPPGTGLCRNGFRTHVPGLLDRAVRIVEREGLDYLKLSFTQFFGDHHLNWAFYNVPPDVRRREFPDGSHRTNYFKTGSEDGLAYALGEVHYSNWPSVMTKAGNQKIFLDEELADPYEQTYMSLCFQKLRRGDLKAGVLLASPINHHRAFHYPANERREN